MVQYISKSAVVAGIRNKVDSYKGDGIISISVLKQHCEDFIDFLDTLDVKEVKEESVSNDLEEAAHLYVDTTIECFDSEGNPCCYPAFIAGAQWQKEHVDKEAIKLAEDHAYFAGSENTREKLIDKACEWLRKGGSSRYLTSEFGEDEINFVKLAEDFRKAMEE